MWELVAAVFSWGVKENAKQNDDAKKRAAATLADNNRLLDYDPNAIIDRRSRRTIDPVFDSLNNIVSENPNTPGSTQNKIPGYIGTGLLLLVMGYILFKKKKNGHS